MDAGGIEKHEGASIESRGMVFWPLGRNDDSVAGRPGDYWPPAEAAGGYRPKDPAHFGVSIQWLIGTAGDVGSDSFDMTVCSPSWFIEQLGEPDGDEYFGGGGLTIMNAGVVLGRGTWFMRRWDSEAFVQAVESVFLDATPAPDFETFARRLDAYIPWEFRYRYEDDANRAHGLPRSKSWPSPPDKPVKRLP